MTTFSEELLDLVKKHYKDNYQDVYIDLVAKLIEKNKKIEGIKEQDIITCIKNGLSLLEKLVSNNQKDKSRKDYYKSYHQIPEVQERRRKLARERYHRSKKDKKREREEDNTELDYSQKVRKLDNGNYMTDDGIVLLPSMKALNEIQTVVKMKVEQ